MGNAADPLIANGRVRVKKCRDGFFAYNIYDTHVGRAMDLYGEFSTSESDLFKQMIQPGMIALDVGANIGCHTVFFANQVGPGGHVIAFEPQPNVFNLLATNVALNCLDNVTLKNSACGTTAGSVQMPPVNYNVEGNFGGVEILDNEPGIKIDLIKIDDMALEHCHFMKIDVEGFEREVLEGGKETIRRAKPIIYAENDRPANSPALLQWLFDNEYRVYWHLAFMFNADNFFGHEENIFGSMVSLNILALPKEMNQNLSGFREITSVEDWPPELGSREG